MNALNIIDDYRNAYNIVPSILVSGVDNVVRMAVFRKWYEMVHKLHAPHLVIDLSKAGEMKGLLSAFGVNIVAHIPGNNCFSVFDSDEFDIEDRLRVKMTNSGWSGEKKDQAIAYILFLKHIYKLETGKPENISMDLISRYSSPKEFEYIIQQLYDKSVIEYREQIALLGRYSELSTVAPDLENLIMARSMTEGIHNENHLNFDNIVGNNVVFVHLGKLKDEDSRKNLLDAVRGKLEKYMFHNGNRPVVTIYSKGKLTDRVITEFVSDLEEMGQVLLMSDNIYGISDSSELQQNFPMRIYSRHMIMDAAEKVQNSFGCIYVRKKTYSTSRDMHMKSRSFWDRMLGTDIVKTEAISAPQPEAKYRKEDIMAFPSGQCIVSFSGQDMMTQLFA